MKYKYFAVDKNRNNISGYETAENSIELLKYLKKNNLYCIKFYKIKDSKLKKIFCKVSYKDISMFCKYMSISLKSGMNFVEIINLVIYRINNKQIKKSLTIIKNEVESGESFNQAMKKFSNLYPKLLVNMIKLGEETGNLEKVFENMEKYYESKYKLKRKFVSSLIYPIIVLSLGLVIQIFFMTSILPTFINQFNLDKGSLPNITKFYIVISKYLKVNKVKVIIVLFMIMFVMYILKNKIYVNKKVSKNLFKIPVVGNLMMKTFRENFSSNMNLLMRSGLNVVESLEYTIDNIGNIYLKEKMNLAMLKIFQGNNCAQSLMETSFFPQFFIEVIAIGEASGTLNESFKTLEDILGEELEEFLDKTIVITQPLTIIIVGILITTLIVAMLMPMLNMIEFINM
ncbi:type II secretion system F family protein [Clostridium sp. ATCC 25772]|uniref:type II secretion system F family protein n=1 Tax=Clostridium sp. ATCC 25772 TaxID=1676991 RepID=UPI0007836D65|nr:type II secretion system F family protein [Clostridium sp. ATCC 25772]